MVCGGRKTFAGDARHAARHSVAWVRQVSAFPGWADRLTRCKVPGDVARVDTERFPGVDEAWDEDDLATEARLAKKLKQGKISKAEYDKHLLGDDLDVL